MMYGKKATAKMMSKPSTKKVAIKAEMMTPKETKKVNKSMNKMVSKPSAKKVAIKAEMSPEEIQKELFFKSKLTTWRVCKL